MMICRTLLVVVALLVTVDAQAQDMSPAAIRAELAYASLGLDDRVDIIPPTDATRSVPLAFALSLAVPGTGQAYNRQWVKAAVGIGAEIGLAAAYLYWDGRGDRAREDYFDYAHQHWSPARYAYWLNDYKRFLNEYDPSRPIGRPDVSVPSGIDWKNPGHWSDADRRMVDQLFAEIRRLEDVMYHHSTGASFAHRLPWFADQQYYELIGKYFHFATGWDDYDAATSPDGRPTWYINGQPLPNIDPEQMDADGNKINIDGRFREYANQHARANDYFRNARHVTTFWILNHVVAAIDAAVFAKLHNDRLSARMGVSHGEFSGLQHSATLTYRF